MTHLPGMITHSLRYHDPTFLIEQDFDKLWICTDTSISGSFKATNPSYPSNVELYTDIFI